MLILNDANIRDSLKHFLNSRQSKPTLIVEELRIHNGNAIADIVCINKTLHCYEIKGETDKIDRALKQGVFYDSTFLFSTIVTTSNHIEKAINIVPKHWGIIEVKLEGNNLKFYTIRSSKYNLSFVTEKALLALWKSELEFIYSQIIKKLPKKNNTRIQLIDEIKSKVSKKIVSEAMANLIYDRFHNKSLQT